MTNEQLINHNDTKVLLSRTNLSSDELHNIIFECYDVMDNILKNPNITIDNIEYNINSYPVDDHISFIKKSSVENYVLIFSIKKGFIDCILIPITTQLKGLTEHCTDRIRDFKINQLLK